VTATAAHPLIQASLLGEALEHGPLAVFVFDDDLRYVAVNSYACTLLGYTREELLTLRAGALAASGDALNDYAEVVGGARPEGRVRVVRKDGRHIMLRFRAYETKVAGMTFYVGAAWPEDETM
jgi:PAS domain S-box-containing protein